MTMTTATYTVERVTTIHLFEDTGLAEYINSTGPELSEKFGNKFNWKNAQLAKLLSDCIFLVCRRNGEIRGHMICYTFKSPLDYTKTILYQLSFYVKPDSGRTAYHLFHKFIDIGKEQANHIITQLTPHTNIKPSTLERLGFEEMETLYRMET